MVPPRSAAEGREEMEGFVTASSSERLYTRFATATDRYATEAEIECELLKRLRAEIQNTVRPLRPDARVVAHQERSPRRRRVWKLPMGASYGTARHNTDHRHAARPSTRSGARGSSECRPACALPPPCVGLPPRRASGACAAIRARV